MAGMSSSTIEAAAFGKGGTLARRLCEPGRALRPVGVTGLVATLSPVARVSAKTHSPDVRLPGNVRERGPLSGGQHEWLAVGDHNRVLLVS